MLLHTATGHVQKLNDYKESEWQANGLLWECKEALRGNLCGCPHCLLGDIYNIIISLAHHWLVFTLFFSFLFWWGGVCWDMGRQIEQRIRKGSFSCLWTLPDWEDKPVFCEMMLVVSKAISLGLFPSFIFTLQRTTAILHCQNKHTHTRICTDVQYVHPHLHAEKYATQRLIMINIYFKHHLIILIE